MRKVLYRYLASDLAIPYIAWTIGLVLMLELNSLFLLLKTAGGNPVPLDGAFRHLVFRIPNALAWSLPMAALFGTAMSINRLSRDGELGAMRMGGMSPRRILAPYIAAGLVCFLGGSIVYDRVMPWANHISDNAIPGMKLSQTLIPTLRPQNFFVKPPGTDKILFARDIDLDTDTLFDVVLCDPFNPDQAEFVVARSAQPGQGQWVLTQGRRYLFDAEARLTHTEPANTLEADLTDVIQHYWDDARSPEEQTWPELSERIRLLHRGGQTAFVEATELHSKLSIPFGCVVLALVVGPLAMRFHGGNFTGMLLAVGTLFVYYVFLTWGKILGHGGTINPVIGAWLQNVVFLGIGGWLTATAR
jgi:lipopolysaccharide export system permease protein